jgi:hypothetical protein
MRARPNVSVSQSWLTGCQVTLAHLSKHGCPKAIPSLQFGWCLLPQLLVLPLLA